MKKATAVLMCFIILLSSIAISACAEENHKFYSVSITAADTVYNEKALIYDDEIYIPAESFSKYTRYEYDAEGHCFTIKGQSRDKAFKFIFIAPDKKQICVSSTGLHWYDLSDYFVVDDIEYLPFCQILPFLNAEIYDVKDEAIYVANNKISLAEVLYDFDIADYEFNMANEFMDSGLLASAFILPSYLLDTVVNTRFGRLDIVTHSGEYNDYKDIFSEFVAEDNLYLKAKAEKPESLGSFLDVFNNTGDIAENMNSVYEWIEKAGKTNISSETGGALLDSLKEYYDSGELDTDSVKGVTDFFTDKDWSKENVSFTDCLKTAEYIYNCCNLIEDNRDMLDAVYDVGTPAKLKNAEKRAAIHVYDLYSDNVIPAVFQEIVSKYSQDVLKEYLSPIAVYTSTAKVAGVILKEVMPFSYGDVSKLSLYSSVVNASSSKYRKYKTSEEGETEKMRLSLLLCLTASKKCFEIMQDTSSGYNMDESYYKDKAKKIEQMIIALYAVAENKKFDSLDNMQTLRDENIKKVKSIINDPFVYEETNTDDSWKKLYINQLDSLNKDEFTGFRLVQIDGDGVPELYAGSNSRFTDGYLYWVYNGQLCEYPIYVNGLSYVEGGNLFLNEGGFQGYCFEEVLSIDRGTTKLRSQGEYFLPEITGYESYTWNGVEMTQYEYETAKLALFDKSISVTPTTYYSYSDICKQITEYVNTYEFKKSDPYSVLMQRNYMYYCEAENGNELYVTFDVDGTALACYSSGAVYPDATYTITDNVVKIVFGDDKKYTWEYAPEEAALYYSGTKVKKTPAKDFFDDMYPIYSELYSMHWNFQNQYEMTQHATQAYKSWDDLLNVVYDYVIEVLPADEASELTSDHKTWISEKENAMESAASEYIGGSMYDMIKAQTGADYTKERVKELIDMIPEP